MLISFPCRANYTLYTGYRYHIGMSTDTPCVNNRVRVCVDFSSMPCLLNETFNEICTSIDADMSRWKRRWANCRSSFFEELTVKTLGCESTPARFDFLVYFISSGNCYKSIILQIEETSKRWCFHQSSPGNVFLIKSLTSSVVVFVEM